MTTLPLTLPVDPDAAKAYEAASEEEQKKVQLLLGLRLQELMNRKDISLSAVMDELSERAKARGLTPEILQSILQDDLLREALAALAARSALQDRAAKLRQANGIWKDRTDLPDWDALRRELDRG